MSRDDRRACATCVVLVAHSVAGLTAPLVCDRVPVKLLVLVNAMVPRSGETATTGLPHTKTSGAEDQS